MGSCFTQESVLVEFFEEALCPFCASFSTKILGPLLRSDLAPYIDFNLVPYGNAKQTSKVCSSKTIWINVHATYAETMWDLHCMFVPTACESS